MRIRTIIEFAAAVSLVVLLVLAQLRPSSPLFWLASLSVTIALVRFGLVLLLLWLVLHTPEHTWLRVLIGLSAGLFAAGLVDATYNSRLGLVDFMTLLPAAIAPLLALLESKPKEQPFRSAEITLALMGWALEKAQVWFSWGLQLTWLLMVDFGISIIGFVSPSALGPETARQRWSVLPVYYHKTGRLVLSR